MSNIFFTLHEIWSREVFDIVRLVRTHVRGFTTARQNGDVDGEDGKVMSVGLVGNSRGGNHLNSKIRPLI